MSKLLTKLAAALILASTFSACALESEEDVVEGDTGSSFSSVDQALTSIGPCWAYTFNDWGHQAAGTQCSSGSSGWNHQVWIRCRRAGGGGDTYTRWGAWVGGNSKSKAVCNIPDLRQDYGINAYFAL